MTSNKRTPDPALTSLKGDTPISNTPKLKVGAVVYMKRESGLQGYGNPQCVSSYTPELGEIGLYGHNEHYPDYQVERIVSSPSDRANTAPKSELAQAHPSNTEQLRQSIRAIKVPCKWNLNGDVIEYDSIVGEETINEVMALIATHTAEAVRAELEAVLNSPTLPPDCPSDCEVPDPEHPRHHHWHHVVRRDLTDRLSQLKNPKGDV